MMKGENCLFPWTIFSPPGSRSASWVWCWCSSSYRDSSLPGFKTQIRFHPWTEVFSPLERSWSWEILPSLCYFIEQEDEKSKFTSIPTGIYWVSVLRKVSPKSVLRKVSQKPQNHPHSYWVKEKLKIKASNCLHYIEYYRSLYCQ